MITANEAYALTKMSIAKKAREAYTDALNVAKHTDDRTSVAICEKVYVDVIDIVNAAVELLVALAENTRDEKAKKHAYSVLEKMEKPFKKKQTTIDDILKAYADFAAEMQKMLDNLKLNKTPGYTAGEFVKEVNKYKKVIKWVDAEQMKNKVLSMEEIVGMCNQIFSD